MPWVRFSSAFDFKPKASVTISYRAGGIYLVARACADAAKAEGKAVDVRRPTQSRVAGARR